MSGFEAQSVRKLDAHQDRGSSTPCVAPVLPAEQESRATVPENAGSESPFPEFAAGRWLEENVSLKDCRVILIPVDFSPDSLQAVRQSLVLAASLSADLLLLHVVHDLPGNPGFYHKKKAGEKLVRKMTEAAEEMMAEFIKESRLESKAKQAGVGLNVRLTRGLPTTQILHAAKREKAGLIVMGSSGRTGISRLLMGSTAEQVVRLAETPVMVVKSG